MEKTYKNRYDDIYTFTLDSDNNILWQGNFKYCRFGMPNDYTRAYEAYCADVKKPMSLKAFKKAVHEWDDETNKHIYPKYVQMVDSVRNKIDMIDPSGGPYISVDMPLDSFGFKDYIVKDFEIIDTGYKIITEKK